MVSTSDRWYLVSILSAKLYKFLRCHRKYQRFIFIYSYWRKFRQVFQDIWKAVEKKYFHSLVDVNIGQKSSYDGQFTEEIAFESILVKEIYSKVVNQENCFILNL